MPDSIALFILLYNNPNVNKTKNKNNNNEYQIESIHYVEVNEKMNIMTRFLVLILVLAISQMIVEWIQLHCQ